LFPGRFRRRKSDSLGPRPASVSSLRARVHTHVDAQHEAGHLTQAASAEQINRRTDTARVSERPRPGGNAGQCKPKIPRIQGFAPPGGVLWFCSASQSHWQNKTTLWGCFDPAVCGGGKHRLLRATATRRGDGDGDGGGLGGRRPRFSPRQRAEAMQPSVDPFHAVANAESVARTRRERRPLEILFGGRQGESPSPPAFAPSRPPALLSA